MRLLIVEDEKQICDMVAKSLYAAGYEVDTCYDGEEASYRLFATASHICFSSSTINNLKIIPPSS